MADDKELEHLKKRILELANRSYSNGIYTFTPFLGLSQQQAFYEIRQQISYVGIDMEGGSPLAERKIIRFGSPERLGYEVPYPIVCLKVEPLTSKFAQPLSHRDFLGAIMNLGIERDTVGDIFVKDHGAVLFCLESISNYLIESLIQVGRTQVRCTHGEVGNELPAPVPEELFLTVSSTRIDTVVSKLYNIARSRSQELFRAGKVYVNGRLTQSSSYVLKNGDVVTVRGFGRFIYTDSRGETRKGKIRVCVEVYR